MPTPPTDRWPDALLDRMRLVGDPVADAVVAEVFKDHDVAELSRALTSLVQNGQIVPADMPELARRFFEATGELPPPDPARQQGAGQMFALFGPEILITLACASLPSCYLDRLGVPVLARTGRLTSDVHRRIAETGQMVIDVASPGGLAPDGQGIRTTQKVRLMHAGIRYLILAKYGTEWTGKLGIPINQEDLAYTLTTFTWVTIAGLRSLDADLSAQQEEDYVAIWGYVGRVLGLLEEMVPANVQESQVLFEKILHRLAGRTPEGEMMEAALLSFIREVVPGRCLRDLGATLTRELCGNPAADLLAVPPANFTRILFHLLRGVTGLFHMFGGSWDPAAGLLRDFGLDLIEGVVKHLLGNRPATFTLTQELREMGPYGRTLLSPTLAAGWRQNRFPRRRRTASSARPIVPR